MSDVPSSSVNVADFVERLALESDCVAMNLEATAALPLCPWFRPSATLRLAYRDFAEPLLRRADGLSCLNMVGRRVESTNPPLVIVYLVGCKQRVWLEKKQHSGAVDGEDPGRQMLTEARSLIPLPPDEEVVSKGLGFQGSTLGSGLPYVVQSRSHVSALMLHRARRLSKGCVVGFIPNRMRHAHLAACPC